jgi:hypothetical protein
MKSVSDKVISRIKKNGRGWVFSGKDFLDLGSRSAVDNALTALAQKGEVRRILRGLYYFPRTNPDLGGELSPHFDAVAHAIARKTGTRIEASGAAAANLLGLSTQVPAKIVYLTNGTSRTYNVGNQNIVFKRVGPKDLSFKPGKSSLVLQAIRHLGKIHVDDTVIKHLRQQLSESDRKALLRDARYTSDWIYEAVKNIASEQGDTDG